MAPSESDQIQYNLETIIENFFPYDSPYADQRTGIKNSLDTFRDKGFHTLEGPCGTGKTLISAVSAIAAIRDPDTPYRRALVVTSVKQQQAAFENDLKEINNHIIDKWGHPKKAPEAFKPITAQTIVGKGDLCPYTDSNAISASNIGGRCSQLMTNTQDAANNHGNKVDGAQSIILSAISQDEDDNSAQNATLKTQDDIAYDTISDSEFSPSPIYYENNEVCPYFAQHMIDSETNNRTIDYEGKVMDASSLRQRAAELGTCPYTAMKSALDDSELIIGNYAHVFHRGTIEAFTHKFIDPTTLLIVDESHMLIERVQDYLSISTSYADLDRAVSQIELVDEYFNSTKPEIQDKIQESLQRYSTSLSDLLLLKELIIGLKDAITRVVEDYCEKNHGPEDTLGKYESIPLRDPEVIEDDLLDIWFAHSEYTDELLEDVNYIAKGAAGALDTISQKTDAAFESQAEYGIERVGGLVTKKFYADNADYFTEISLTGKSTNKRWSYTADDTIDSNYSITVNLHNCMPARGIERTLSKFGGGLLMSATLSPIDIYQESVGLTNLDRPTTQDTFDLGFPENNRGSWIVPLDPFTSSNRGDPTESNSVRTDYANTIEEITTATKGNTLVCMPSYKEAEWISELMKSWTEQPVYLDESSTNEETTALKSKFEQEDEAYLVTSLRGTLTEGVDYSGEKLSNVIIVGVPLTNPYSNRAQARETAYAIRFTRSNSFEYAFTLPAMYKTRQAIGRVIRSTSDVGTRILIDRRYTEDGNQSVYDFLSPQEQSDFIEVKPDMIQKVVSSFWQNRTN